MPKIVVGRSDDAKRRKKNEDGLIAAILIFKCTEGAGVGIAVGRMGARKIEQTLHFSRFLPNRTRPHTLSSFDTHSRWQ